MRKKAFNSKSFFHKSIYMVLFQEIPNIAAQHGSKNNEQMRPLITDIEIGLISQNPSFLSLSSSFNAAHNYLLLLVLEPFKVAKKLQC